MAVKAGNNGREESSPIAYMQYNMLYADEGICCAAAVLLRFISRDALLSVLMLIVSNLDCLCFVIGIVARTDHKSYALLVDE